MSFNSLDLADLPVRGAPVPDAVTVSPVVLSETSKSLARLMVVRYFLFLTWLSHQMKRLRI